MKKFVLGIASVIGLMVSNALPASADTAVVLIHGKDGNALLRSPVPRLAALLESDFKIESPDMPEGRDGHARCPCCAAQG
ncbi:MAG: hypothetical protein VW547_14945 [Alphaproteobacteria bacterium]|jgi:hypothetical protein